jgi:hypothetical protein
MQQIWFQIPNVIPTQAVLVGSQNHCHQKETSCTFHLIEIKPSHQGILE